MSRQASAVVEGWRFTGYEGGVYVDVQPPGCRTAIEAVWVAGEPVTDPSYLSDLGREWLTQNRPNLAGYIESARWYDREVE
jgi:hypothetical protein